MLNEERKLYEALFPNDNNPYYINYGYFTGGSLRAFSILKGKIKRNYIDPILIEDDINEGSFFVKIHQKDVDIFMLMVKPLKYKQKKIPRNSIENIRILFGDR